MQHYETQLVDPLLNHLQYISLISNLQVLFFSGIYIYDLLLKPTAESVTIPLAGFAHANW